MVSDCRQSLEKLLFFEDDLSDFDYNMRRLNRNAVIVGRRPGTVFIFSLKPPERWLFVYM
ncbi:hypothetical protein FM106_07970 [Brachybacterium faecium]|nr:hypothetical protein FM106_07970 [Brachybacterium faecium]